MAVYPSGDMIRAYPFAMRAPEVYLDHTCTEPSQVWAVAAMLLCWIKPSVLGVHDSPHSMLNEAWAMAKIKRLFPNWSLPPPEEVPREVLRTAIRIARRISREEPEMQNILALEEETQKVEMPQQLRDLLGLMLVVDPSVRPSASDVLTSNEFRELEKLVQAA